MNHFSYEVMQKQKIRDLQKEGMISQSVYRAGASGPALLRALPRIVGLLGVLGLLVLLVW